MRHSFQSAVSRLAGQTLSLPRQARLVATFLPASRWHQAAEWISRAHGALSQLARKNGALTRTLMFDHWLRELTLCGAFPIRWRNADDAALQAEPGRGILFCWTHTPLIEMTLSAIMELGHPAPLMVCDPGRIVDGNKFVAPGQAERVEAIQATSGSLRRVLAELRAGRSVAWLTDAALGGVVSGQLLRLAQISGARLVFLWGERDPDGSIAIHFADPPFPDCENDAAIEANLEVLRRERLRLLRMLHVSNAADAAWTVTPAHKPVLSR